MTERFIRINTFGDKIYYRDKAMKVLHREDGPAFEGGGMKIWYLNGERHRTDGPAYECSTGFKMWYFNGELHRTDGPAIMWASGRKEWHVNGKRLSEDEFNAQYGPKKPSCEGKTVEVDGVKYKLVKA